MPYSIAGDPNYVCIERSRYEWLLACYWSPMTGMRDVATNLLIEWGHTPADHSQLLDVMEIELSGALIETAGDVMREHGLRDLRVETAATPAP